MRLCMEILTQKKINHRLYRKDRRVSSDGWVNTISCTSEFDKIQNIEYKGLWKSDFELSFKVTITTECVPSEVERKIASYAIFEELYGGILYDLQKIEFLIKNSSRDNTHVEVKKLIDKLRN